MRTIEETDTLNRGTIISFNSGFVVVVDDVSNKKMLCSLRGRFKITNTKPLVGDKIEYIIEGDRGRVESISSRHNTIEKPKVSNVDQVIAVFTISKPDVPLTVIDRTLANIKRSISDILLVLNKVDITEEKKITEFKRIYRIYDFLPVSTFTNVGIEELKEKLKDKISVFAGPSGVGKSSLINAILDSKLKTGFLSDKTNLGKHTTTAASLLTIPNGGFVVDTPGFTTVGFLNMDPFDVQKLFPEIIAAASECAFDDCVHESEPGCNVKKLVESGEISKNRYDDYLAVLNEVKVQKMGDAKFEKKR